MAGNILQEWVASGAFTITLTGLATSSTKVAGREGTALSLTSDDPLGVLIGGLLTPGTSPTVNTQLEVWMYASLNDTPTYPVNITGSNAAATMASENQRNSAVRLATSINIDSTSDRNYSFGPIDVVQLWGSLPRNIGPWVTHNTAVNLNATAANQRIDYTATYARYT